MEGTVIKSTGSRYTVRNAEGDTVHCIMRGVFRMKETDSTNPIAVGDKVEYSFSDDGQSCLIVKIYDRKNYIIRKAKNLSRQSHIIASNIDRVFLVASLIQPKTSLGFIDRLLVAAESYRIPVTILFNKSDLYDEKTKDYFEILKSIYEPLGYPCFMISSFNEQDIKMVKDQMENMVQMFTGHSGVGKSSLVNALEPNLHLKVDIISQQHQKGKHTTTFAEMHPLSNGGFIVDTPGIKEFGMYDISKEEISHYFPEMRALLNQCQFNNCLHFEEPNCAVKQAVADGTIHEWRYYNYLSILSNDDNYN